MTDSETRGSSKKELVEAKNLMRKNLEIEFSRYFGLTDAAWIDRATNNWFHDENIYDGRWNVIRERAPEAKKTLDVVAGCGTFLVYGLERGYDAWGIEPEAWKREYPAKKISALNYPAGYLDRVVDGIGEALPFDDESPQTRRNPVYKSTRLQLLLRAPLSLPGPYPEPRVRAKDQSS